MGYRHYTFLGFVLIICLGLATLGYVKLCLKKNYVVNDSPAIKPFYVVPNIIFGVILNFLLWETDRKYIIYVCIGTKRSVYLPTLENIRFTIITLPLNFIVVYKYHSKDHC